MCAKCIIAIFWVLENCQKFSNSNRWALVNINLTAQPNLLCFYKKRKNSTQYVRTKLIESNLVFSALIYFIVGSSNFAVCFPCP